VEAIYGYAQKPQSISVSFILAHPVTVVWRCDNWCIVQRQRSSVAISWL